ncbi:hypothetical protein [Vagococcus fluvialis]|uniref:hypothetical protein n=1 Tax=Vagococcus fluvialis TaxID=2738 RepID=UPI003B219A3E
MVRDLTKIIIAFLVFLFLLYLGVKFLILKPLEPDSPTKKESPQIEKPAQRREPVFLNAKINFNTADNYPL